MVFVKMKFRAEMTDLPCMKSFATILETLSRFSKEYCVVRICTDKIYFIVTDDSITARHPLVWCVFDQATVFSKFYMAGLNESRNEIYLEFSPDMMARSFNFLRCSQGADKMTLKLTDKNSPCLTFDIVMSSGRVCIQDIPVVVLPYKQWKYFSEPELPNFDVSLQLPNSKLVRSILERLKTLSHEIAITASSEGNLVLKVETDMANMATYFKDLIVLDKTESQDTVTASARVDLKKLSEFFSTDQVNYRPVTCKILDDKLLYANLVYEDIMLQFALPSIII